LIAQHCNRGTVKPTFYRIIYSNSSLEEGILSEVIFTQCFNYMNWTGSIKIPAVMQYAKKLSIFAAQYINRENQNERLNRNLYFI
jgi:aubergine-like protein